MNTKLINGKKIERMWMIGGTYNPNSVEVRLDNGEAFRIESDQLLDIVKEYSWIPKKKRIHTYLTKEGKLDGC